MRIHILFGAFILLGMTACGSSSSSGTCNCVTAYVYAVRQTATNCDPVRGGAVPVCVVGDNAANEELRGLVEFSLVSLPPGTRLASAYLTVFETLRAGDPDPLGSMLLDHVDGTQLTGAPADCANGTLEPAFTTLFEDNA